MGYLETLTSGKLSSFQKTKARALNPPDILIEVSRNSYSTFDFYKASELIEMGMKYQKSV